MFGLDSSWVNKTKTTRVDPQISLKGINKHLLFVFFLDMKYQKDEVCVDNYLISCTAPLGMVWQQSTIVWTVWQIELKTISSKSFWLVRTLRGPKLLASHDLSCQKNRRRLLFQKDDEVTYAPKKEERTLQSICLWFCVLQKGNNFLGVLQKSNQFLVGFGNPSFVRHHAYIRFSLAQ